MDRHVVALSVSARWLGPALLMLAGIVVLVVVAVLLGAPSVEDLGSWRWVVARQA